MSSTRNNELNMEKGNTTAKPSQESELDDLINFLNVSFAHDDDICKIEQVLMKLVKEYEDLTMQMSFPEEAVSLPNDNSMKGMELLDSLKAKYSKLKTDVDTLLAAQSINFEKLKKTSEMAIESMRGRKYAAVLNITMKHSCAIEQAVGEDNWDKAVLTFAELSNIALQVQETKCAHLLNFVNTTLKTWYKYLRETWASDFEESLKYHGWPFVKSALTGSISAKSSQSKEIKKTMSKQNSQQSVAAHEAFMRESMPTLFMQLIKLRLPDNMTDDEEEEHVSSSQRQAHLLLPLNLLLRPLVVRFKFHFCGSKKTNNPDKPEWYFTQVMSWIRDHTPFLEKSIQPLLHDAGITNISAVDELSRGLVMLVIDKLTSDAHLFEESDTRLSHMIDETLLFHEELRTLGYPASYPSCLAFLCEPTIYSRWLEIERKTSIDKEDVILTSANAWSSLSVDDDERMPPECVQAFVAILTGITERYKAIPFIDRQLEFLNLQIELLDDFRVRILQIKGQHETVIARGNYCDILNGVNFMIFTLKNWNNEPFFVQMQHYKLQYAKLKSVIADSETVGTSAFISKNEMEKRHAENVGVFQEMLQYYDHIKNEMMSTLLSAALYDVKSKALPYRRNKWMAIPAQSEFSSLSLSNSACGMLMTIQDRLHFLQTHLCKQLFGKIWHEFALQLNVFLFEDIILTNYFNDGGAAQLRFDMTRNLFPLFGEYTANPENLFKSVKEACILLNLSKGTAMLLKEAIIHMLYKVNVADSNVKTGKIDPRNSLQEIGVHNLNLENVEKVLSLKVDTRQ